MCPKHHNNPIPTVDTIIEWDSMVLLVKRKNKPFKGYFVLPGGFVDEGEKIEDAARREVKEETSLDIQLVDILGVYSDPKRDPRGHIISTVFIGKIPAYDKYEGEAFAQDNASEIEWMNLRTISKRSFGFDHKRILLDYKKWKESGRTFWSSKDEDTS
jgi:8-oxo-dGTP diphosphatase